VVREFPDQGRWLASPENPETPVCIPNGCILRVTNIPKNLQKDLKIRTEAIAECREIIQQTATSLLARIFLPPRLCFDVVLFSKGRSLEITVFTPGVTVDVLSPAVATPVREAKEDRERALSIFD